MAAALVLLACQPTVPPPLSDCEQSYMTEDLSRAQAEALRATHALVREHCEGLAEGCSMGVGSGNPYPISVFVAPVAAVDSEDCTYASHPKWTYFFTAKGELAETNLDMPHPHRNPLHERPIEIGGSDSSVEQVDIAD